MAQAGACRGAALCLAGWVFATITFVVSAQQPVAPIPAPRFEIKRFDVQGNTLLSPEVVAAAVTPFAGKNKDFADIQRALDNGRALQALLYEAGRRYANAVKHHRGQSPQSQS